MARVLVTGGAGYVGSHAAKALSRAGHEPLALDNLSTGHREFVRWGPLVEGDIRDRSVLDSVMSGGGFDAVMHFAALAYVGASVSEPNAYYDVNVNGTRTLLDAMLRAGVPHVVFSSSCAVYGQPGRLPISEDESLRPVNPYGFTKMACERMMDDFGHAYGLRSVRLRYFNAAGADPDGEVGEHHDPETHIIPVALDVALGRRPSVAIYGEDYPTVDGTALRDYIHVADLATAHVMALEHLLAGGRTHALNLGTGHGATVAQVVHTAARVAGRPIERRLGPRRPGDPAQLVACADQATEVLGWEPVRSALSTIIEDAWMWHQKRFGEAFRG